MLKRNLAFLFLLAIACSPAWGHAEAGQVICSSTHVVEPFSFAKPHNKVRPKRYIGAWLK